MRGPLAERTLEWDLAAAGNVEVMLERADAVKPRVAASAAEPSSPA